MGRSLIEERIILEVCLNVIDGKQRFVDHF